MRKTLERGGKRRRACVFRDPSALRFRAKRFSGLLFVVAAHKRRTLEEMHFLSAVAVWERKRRERERELEREREKRCEVCGRRQPLQSCSDRGARRVHRRDAVRLQQLAIPARGAGNVRDGGLAGPASSAVRRPLVDCGATRRVY